MTGSRITRLGTLSLGVLILALAAGPTPAVAAPDFDGAADALVATAFDATGDLVGSAGLVSAAVLGAGGDLVALIDDNEVTRVVLRGVLSKAIRLTALGTSQMSTGALEGFRGEDFANFPEPAKDYLDPENFEVRVATLVEGVGALALGTVDILANPSLFILRLVGLTDQADSIAKFQTEYGGKWLGATK